MNKTVLTIILAVILFACSNYENKERYTISVGEKVEIYYFTSSCCTFEVANLESLDNINFLEQKTIDTGPKDCSGCTGTSAFVFKAISPGMDTVKLKHIVISKRNDNNSDELNNFIIEVSN